MPTGRPSFQAAQADGFAGFLAVAVAAILDAMQRLIDLRDQFTRPIPGSQLQCSVGFHTRSVGNVGFVDAAFRQAGKGAIGLPDQIHAPTEQFLTKIFRLDGIHDFFAVHGPIVRGQAHHHTR